MTAAAQFPEMVPPHATPEQERAPGVLTMPRRPIEREDRRFVVNQPASLYLRGVNDYVWESHITDISRRGMQLVVESPVAPSGRVRIAWNGRDILGTIRYQRRDGDEYRLGVELTSSWETLVVEVLARQSEELRESNLALAERTAVLRHQADLLDMTYDTILVTDVEGVISSWNLGAERMYGWTKAEAVGRNAHEMLATVFPAEESEIHAALLRNGRWEGELVQFRKDGSEIVVASRLALHRAVDGAAAFIMGINSDITEKKKAERELVTYAAALAAKNRELGSALKTACDASEVKSRFLASVSHELRTPLNGIIGFSQMLHDGVLGAVNQEQVGCLGDVLSCSDHLLSLINQVLDLSRIESGKMEISYSTVRLESIAREVVDALRAISSARQIEVRWKVDPAVSMVETDPSRIRQVMFNYLSNALKFTPPGGEVSLQVLSADEAHYMIAVEDNGIGIREEDLQRLFTEFGQLTPGGPDAGTGLGLVITRGIVENLGGTVGVTSAPGKGSRFHAVMPLTRNDR